MREVTAGSCPKTAGSLARTAGSWALSAAGWVSPSYRGGTHHPRSADSPHPHHPLRREQDAPTVPAHAGSVIRSLVRDGRDADRQAANKALPGEAPQGEDGGPRGGDSRRTRLSTATTTRSAAAGQRRLRAAKAALISIAEKATRHRGVERSRGVRAGQRRQHHADLDAEGAPRLRRHAEPVAEPGDITRCRSDRRQRGVISHTARSRHRQRSAAARTSRRARGSRRPGRSCPDPATGPVAAA